MTLKAFSLPAFVIGILTLLGFNHVTSNSFQPGPGQSTFHLPVVGTFAPHAATATPKTSQSSSPASPSNTLPVGSAWLSQVPLGDGKYVTTGPKTGYVYVCHVASGGGGAEGTPTWIHGSTWTPSEKVNVSGSVAWSNASYAMHVSGSSRMITSNGLPTDHNTGKFPVQASDPAYQFDRNPNSIKAQSLSFTIPAYPSAASTPGCIYGMVGIMNNGVELFDGFDAEYRDAVAHETQDAWDGHPQESGAYHDHGFEESIRNKMVSEVAGFAFDGFPITGPKLPNGNYLTTADLDECHGITSSVTVDGKLVTTYHYVLTQDFPYSVACFKGKSYEPHPGGQSTQGSTPSNGGGNMPGQPPQAAIDSCSGKTSGSSCSFNAPQGAISGTCQTPPNGSLACVPR